MTPPVTDPAHRHGGPGAGWYRPGPDGWRRISDAEAANERYPDMAHFMSDPNGRHAPAGPITCCPSCGTAWPDLPPAHHLELAASGVAVCGDGQPVPACDHFDAVIGTQLTDSLALAAATVLPERMIGLPVVGETPHMTGLLDALGPQQDDR